MPLCAITRRPLGLRQYDSEKRQGPVPSVLTTALYPTSVTSFSASPDRFSPICAGRALSGYDTHLPINTRTYATVFV